MWEMFVKGGPVMYPIALCSIVALAVFLERCWTYWRIGRQTGKLAHEVEPLAAKTRLEEALTICHRSEAPLAGGFLVALRNAGRPRAEIKAAVEEAGQREATQLLRFLGLLSTIAVALALTLLWNRRVVFTFVISHASEFVAASGAPLTSSLLSTVLTPDRPATGSRANVLWDSSESVPVRVTAPSLHWILISSFLS